MQRIPSLACALLLAACGGGSGDTDVVAPSFTEVRDDILVPSCGLTSCHSAGEEGGLTINASSTPADWVGVAAVGAPSETLIVAGDADASYFIHKMEGAAGIVDDPMPPPFGGLPAEDIEAVRAWINAGALDD